MFVTFDLIVECPSMYSLMSRRHQPRIEFANLLSLLSFISGIYIPKPSLEHIGFAVFLFFLWLQALSDAFMCAFTEMVCQIVTNCHMNNNGYM